MPASCSLIATLFMSALTAERSASVSRTAGARFGSKGLSAMVRCPLASPEPSLACWPVHRPARGALARSAMGMKHAHCRRRARSRVRYDLQRGVAAWPRVRQAHNPRSFSGSPDLKAKSRSHLPTSHRGIWGEGRPAGRSLLFLDDFRPTCCSGTFGAQ
jgi:hypothetical protein